MIHLSSVNRDAEPKFLAELKRLAQYIHKAKLDIAAIQPKTINSSHIPLATNELDAVVGATEDATNKIMDACDAISRIAQTVSIDAGAGLLNCTTQIYEACNFQDITGQRITKVVATLKHIDMTVESLLSALGEELRPSRDGSEELSLQTSKKDASNLLNGPQLPGQGVDQKTVDRLLEEK